MSRLLRLLPSRPDRIHKVSLRGDRKVTIEKPQTLILKSFEAAHYEQRARLMQPTFMRIYAFAGYFLKRSSAI